MKLLVANACLLGVLSIFLLSCGGGDDPVPVAASPTFLKVGTRFDFYYDDGFFFSDSLKTIVDGQVATDTFRIRHYSETVLVGGTQYWVIKDDVFYSSIRLRDPSTYLIECKFGQPVGTSWEVMKAGVKYTYTIEELNASITTGDDVVTDAIKIKITSASGQQAVQYISPTVGLLGNGSIDESVTMRLIHHRVGSFANITGATPRITFGSFPFLVVGKYWNYTESSLFGGEVAVNLLIESKLASNNIYKIKLTYDGTISYSYWYEDNGMLMAYDEGENLLNADPIYLKDNIAAVGNGWASLTKSGTMFIYKITALNKSTSSFFGDLPCMEINVTDGLFSNQSNYWNANKGNVLVSGIVSREITSSNARKRTSKSFIPVVPF